ncbi:MAG: hypothetical protein KIS90_11375 [Phenylobacterium sp.]|nr:hypothetical protein [Phenylobacterium sp.]
MRNSLMAGASALVHMAGIGRTSRRDRLRDGNGNPRSARRSRAEEDDDDNRADEDERRSRRSRAEDDDERESRRSRADDDERQYPDAEDDDDDRQSRRSRADDDDDDGDRASRRSRRSRAEDDDDDKDASRRSRRSRAEEDDEDEKASAARAERSRARAILAHPVARSNPDLAEDLIDSDMSKAAALRILDRQEERDAHDVRDGRRARNPDLAPGDDRGGGRADSRAIQSGWDRAIEAAAGSVRTAGQKRF